VLVVAPWNYPLAIPLRNIIPALMAGNTVVFKPASQALLVGQVLAKLFTDVLPPGVFQLLKIQGAQTEKVIEFGVDFVSFTGSVEVGRRVAQLAAKHFIPHALELGGKDAAIVLEDADLERTAHGIVWGAFTNAGQNCASIERVYVVETIADNLITRMQQLTAELQSYADVSQQNDYDLGPLVTPSQQQITLQHIDDFRHKGAKILVGGDALKLGLGVKPTLIINASHTMQGIQEETFGPTLPVMVVKDAQDAVNKANDCHYGLTTSIWTRDIKRGENLAKQLQTGVVTINNCCLTASLPELPWSGWKDTGYGTTNSERALMEMVRPKVIFTDRYKRRELWWYPYNQKSVQLAKAYLEIFRRKGLSKIAPAIDFLKGMLTRFKS